MIDDLRAITLFVKTVELGSFRECARQFNFSPSVVSQKISDLEKKHGVTLLYRSTRKLTLTSEGEVFFNQARQMVESAEHALNALSQKSKNPSGKLTITMPAGLIKSEFMTKLGDFALKYPQVQLDIQFSDKRMNMIAEGFDLAIRAGNMEDSALKSLKIGHIQRILVAAPDYLKDRPAPQHINDLRDWDWIKMKMMPPYRRFIGPDDTICDIPFTPQVEIDNVDAMVELTKRGLGLSTPSDFQILDDLDQGTLVQILPEWKTPQMDVYAVWPENSVRKSLTDLLLKELNT
jgi:DNA-binding transcriptional LysR family regulator